MRETKADLRVKMLDEMVKEGRALKGVIRIGKELASQMRTKPPGGDVDTEVIDLVMKKKVEDARSHLKEARKVCQVLVCSLGAAGSTRRATRIPMGA